MSTMKKLATLKDSDFGLEDKDPGDFQLRHAARAVIFDDGGRVLMMHVAKYDYYKCPGGGIQDGEDIRLALSREMLEEAGCKGEIVGEIGQIDEFRSRYNLKQISYLYLVRMTEIGPNNLEEDELDDGFEVIWFKDIDEAIAVLEGVEQTQYGELFMSKRELLTLQFAKEAIYRNK